MSTDAPLATPARNGLAGVAAVVVRRAAGVAARGHWLALAALALLTAVMFRTLVGSRYPGGMDAAFLYSQLAYFKTHGLTTFAVWLPAPLGQVQQYSLYWFLGGITALVGHPLTVYKAAMFAIAYLGAVGAYGFAFWLCRSRLASFVAAFLYSAAPIAASNWLLGHLNVSLSYSLGPFAVWCAAAAVRGARGAGIGLGLTGSALYLLTTGQAPYWGVPMAAMIVAELTAARGGGELRAAVRRFARAVGAAGVTFVAASAVEVLPTAAGLRAPFVEGGAHYYIQQLSVHRKYSFPFGDNVLGLPEAARYLVDGATLSVGGTRTVVHALLAGVIVALAFAALLTPARRVAVALSASVVCVWLLASGPGGPIAPVYRLLYTHMPFFSYLRVPNRWLMVAALGEAMLVAILVAFVLTRRRLVGYQIAFLAVAVAAVLGSTIVVHGMPALRTPAPYADTYEPLRADRADWRIATTPFFQSWMGAQAGDLSVSSDLGYTSSVWHDHATLGRGGWDPRAARYVEFLYDLVREGSNPGVAKLLGVAGVKYVGTNPYPALEVVGNQNAFFRGQPGLRLLRARSGIALYRNEYALPQAFEVQRACAVAGGYPVLGDLAATTSFDPRTVVLQFADQARALGGAAAVDALLAQDRCLVIGAGGRAALTVLQHATAIEDVATFAPASWDRAPLRASYDIGAEPRYGVAAPIGGSAHVRIGADAGRYRVWVSALLSPQSGGVHISVDGRDAGTVLLRSVAGTGVRWLPSRAVHVGGGQHRIVLSYRGLGAKAPGTLTQIALVPARAQLHVPRGVRVSTEIGGDGPIARVDARRPSSLLAGAWQGLSVQKQVVATPRRHGIEIDVRRPDRPYYTVAYAPTVGRIDPYRPIAIRFRGTGSRETFYLDLQFDTAGEQVVGYRFVDTSRRERTLVFLPTQPSFGWAAPRWDHVRRVTLSIGTKRAFRQSVALEGPFQLAGPSLLPRFSAVPGGPPASSALVHPDQQISTHADVTAASAGMLVFTQSYHRSWRLDAPASHELAYGFANAYRLRRPVQAGQLSFTGARWGRIGTFLSGIAWLVALAVLAVRLRPGVESRGNRANL